MLRWKLDQAENFLKDFEKVNIKFISFIQVLYKSLHLLVNISRKLHLYFFFLWFFLSITCLFSSIMKHENWPMTCKVLPWRPKYLSPKGHLDFHNRNQSCLQVVRKHKGFGNMSIFYSNNLSLSLLTSSWLYL